MDEAVRAAVPVDELYLDTIRDHLTKKTLDKVMGWTRKRLRFYRSFGVPFGDDAGEIYVEDAIADTVSRRLNWRPGACALSTHLIGAVRNRTHKEAQRFWRGTGSLAALQLLEDSSSGAVAYEVVGPEELERQIALRQLLSKIIPRLYEATKDNEHVQLILVAFEDGVSPKPQELAEATGLSVSEVHNAKKRLERILAKTPASFRHEVTALLGSTS